MQVHMGPLALPVVRDLADQLCRATVHCQYTTSFRILKQMCSRCLIPSPCARPDMLGVAALPHFMMGRLAILMHRAAHAPVPLHTTLAGAA